MMSVRRTAGETNGAIGSFVDNKLNNNKKEKKKQRRNGPLLHRLLCSSVWYMFVYAYEETSMYKGHASEHNDTVAIKNKKRHKGWCLFFLSSFSFIIVSQNIYAILWRRYPLVFQFYIFIFNLMKMTV